MYLVRDTLCFIDFLLIFVNSVFFFFFNDSATTEIYTLSLHDALPISFAGGVSQAHASAFALIEQNASGLGNSYAGDRKSTRLNSSHTVISYAVFCLKKKKIP